MLRGMSSFRVWVWGIARNVGEAMLGGRAARFRWYAILLVGHDLGTLFPSRFVLSLPATIEAPPSHLVGGWGMVPCPLFCVGVTVDVYVGHKTFAVFVRG